MERRDAEDQSQIGSDPVNFRCPRMSTIVILIRSLSLCVFAFHPAHAVPVRTTHKTSSASRLCGFATNPAPAVPVRAPTDLFSVALRLCVPSCTPPCPCKPPTRRALLRGSAGSRPVTCAVQRAASSALRAAHLARRMSTPDEWNAETQRIKVRSNGIDPIRSAANPAPDLRASEPQT